MIQPGLVWELARKDLKLFAADRRAAFLCFAVPVLLASAFGAVFHRPAGGEVRLPVLLVAEDDGPLTRRVVAAQGGDEPLLNVERHRRQVECTRRSPRPRDVVNGRRCGFVSGTSEAMHQMPDMTFVQNPRAESRAAERPHTREIDAYGGLVNRMPAYALVFMFFTMANVGLPGTSGFIGEFLTLAGIFQVNTWVAAVAATGVILSAAYALWLYRRVVFGDLIKESLKSITDMSAREKAIFAPLVAMTLFLGIYPKPVLDVIQPTVTATMHALGATDPAPATQNLIEGGN